MSDHHDRGAYTPQSDAPLAFDARSSRRGGGQPMPVTLIISGVILIILVAAMAVFFVHNARDNGTAPSAGQSIDAIKSPAAVPEAKPAEQSGVQIGYTQGNPPIPTDANTASASGAPTFTAPPETPGVRPPPAAAPAPGKPQTIDAILKEAPAKPAPKTSDQIIAEAAPKPVQTVTKPKPAPKAAASAPATKPEPKLAATAAAGPMVQIGAFSSQALAEQSMNAVSAKVPGRVAGKTLKVEKAEVDGKTLNRALIGGFKSRADADSFCAELKAQGGVCSVRD